MSSSVFLKWKRLSDFEVHSLFYYKSGLAARTIEKADAIARERTGNRPDGL